ncbi:MAG: bifunctional UDP-N-acetylmuramoyl-tripeptide:D-alanyl-D-alanine ligase/alanine racemase [Bacteroidetes bacterium]|nr:bifunctional UDP-N-acetylmuramoyl-tripeptide:D-alanyl-D-alanine ligase/alanine racemase [Bacteroidota bacterium]
MYYSQQIAEITNSVLIGNNNLIAHFFVDSRLLQNNDKQLFIAIKTDRNDGHNYIQQLVDKGVCSFIVNTNFEHNLVIGKNLCFIKSDNPLQVLQNLAAYHRSKFNIPIIGITGSNGKTIVKEWLYQLLKSNYSICRSPKSYNSQIGVPLSVLNLNEWHTLGIFEAGISTTGEMDVLQNIIKPTIGIFTSLGDAHSSGFKNNDEKISEKLKLFKAAKFVILNGLEVNDHTTFTSTQKILIAKDKGDLTFKIEKNTIEFNYLNSKFNVNTNFTDEASVSNIASCVALLMYLKFNTEQIQNGIKHLTAIALRLEIKNGIKNSLLINDFYNSDYDSLKIALSFQEQQHRRLKKIVIISDIEQSGFVGSQLYNNISQLLNTSKIDLLVGIGTEISKHKFKFQSNSIFYTDTTNFINQFKFIEYQFSNSTILLKGARSFGFEAISKLLQQKSHDTVFEINLNKIVDNINYYKSLLNSSTKIMAMIKATGYGNGSSEIAKTLQYNGINYLAVAYADEGVELRDSQIKLPIMVMNPEIDSLDDIITYQLEPEIYSFRILNEFINCLNKYAISEPYPIHIKIDTGMHRLGFEKNDIDKLISILRENNQIKVTSIFSHLVGSDNPELDDFTNFQIKLFTEITDEIENKLKYKTLKHICNSGGISRFKNAHFDMVRLGIGMYGVGVNAIEQNNLQHVGKLSTKISQIKKINKGESVGYNRNAFANNDLIIATIPIGYADGFNRQLGNGKHGVYINNIFCKTIGNICMDMCMIDITEINCNEGDEVVIFSNNAELTQIAKTLNTITYEVLTSVSSRVKRIYIQE